jgi:hypothetical protein
MYLAFHLGRCSTMTDSEYGNAKRLTEARRQARGQRLLQAVHPEIKNYAQEVAYLASEKQNATSDPLKNWWEAICYQIARGKPGDFANYEEDIRGLCQEVLLRTDNFIPKLFAICTTEYDDFYQKAGLREEPSTWSVREWASEAIYARVLENARAEVETGFLSYEQRELERLLHCSARKRRSTAGMPPASSGVNSEEIPSSHPFG